jgi:hypothetical protein
LSSEG